MQESKYQVFGTEGFCRQAKKIGVSSSKQNYYTLRQKPIPLTNSIYI